MALILAGILCACSTTHNKESADREVYELIDARREEVPGMPSSFSISPEDVSLEGKPVAESEPVVALSDGSEGAFLGDAGKEEVGAVLLSLEDALDIAVKASRDYQARKEALYLQALSFTATRQKYQPVFSGRAEGTYRASTVDVSKLNDVGKAAEAAPDLLRDVAALTGTPADLLNAYANLIEGGSDYAGLTDPEIAIMQEREIEGGVSAGASILMKGGTQIAVNLTSNFLRYLTGDPNVSTSSALVGSITQPLLGSERRTAAETLTQAERDLLYGLRTFTRYRKSFSINIASEYYRVLQARDSVRNNFLGYEAFKQNLKRAEAMADAGRITKTELGRNREEALQSENNWVRAVQSYQDYLDRFKIQLGLSTDARVVLDDGELDRLLEAGLGEEPKFSLEDALDVAFAARLDYYTERDRADDAFRELGLAEDGLKPDIALALGAQINSKPGDRFQELDFKRYVWSLGLDIDPKLNRKLSRNSYRRALISYAAARRELEEFEDNIKLEVRGAWRELEQARVSYTIQMNSLKESERRVLHQTLLFEAGEGKALDQIDAENALIAARNRVSAALVDYTIANLSLWLDMGILYIKENGQWEDISDVQETGKS